MVHLIGSNRLISLFCYFIPDSSRNSKLKICYFVGRKNVKKFCIKCKQSNSDTFCTYFRNKHDAASSLDVLPRNSKQVYAERLINKHKIVNLLRKGTYLEREANVCSETMLNRFRTIEILFSDTSMLIFGGKLMKNSLFASLAELSILPR